MDTNAIIILARKHVHNAAAMQSSAELCLAEAIALRDAGDLPAAAQRAIKSLAYSVGILHQDHLRAVLLSRPKKARDDRAQTELAVPVPNQSSTKFEPESTDSDSCANCGAHRKDHKRAACPPLGEALQWDAPRDYISGREELARHE